MAKKSNTKNNSNSNKNTNSNNNSNKKSSEVAVEYKSWSIPFYTLASMTLLYFLSSAYNIRMTAIRSVGTVIHEFDPYFNYRATEYLYYNGISKFFTWFDHQSWYPLGRPVGTTIYPGMQVTAVFIKNHIMKSMSLNDVCVYIPVWFGVIASLLVGLIAYECTLECNSDSQILIVLWNIVADEKNQIGSLSSSQKQSQQQQKKKKSTTTTTTTAYDVDNKKLAVLCGVLATGIMGIIPAHLMRSVGGGFDNESVAITAMMLTFYFWVRSLRGGEKYSYLFGILTGFSYFYMVATWGGYVFVLNMIGLHAALLVAFGRFTTKVYLSYTLFYAIGTVLAIQIPVVGLTPLKSLEQVGCFVIFAAYQLLFVCEQIIQKKKLSRTNSWKLRFRIFSIALVIAIVIMTLFLPKNYFGPISSRIRGLFVKHTKTGNPLVDSVAEHQPAQASAYYSYLHQFCSIAPIGFIMVLRYFGDGPLFLCAYAVTAYFFSHKMVRLVLLMGPIASALGGIAMGRIVMWSFAQFYSIINVKAATATAIATSQKGESLKNKSSEKRKKSKKEKEKEKTNDFDEFPNDMIDIDVESKFKGTMFVLTKRIVAFGLLLTVYFSGKAFENYCWTMSTPLSNASIISFGKLRNGTTVKMDDYREAYWWVRDNTPKDARIMAWWDYGYQIAAIANRTTIADGNTWNHEHIALLGKIYTTEVNEAYSIARHLADYILVWAGGGGDDLAKSPHLARIANSVFRDFCPGDPVCSSFGLVRAPNGQGTTPSPKMHASLVHHLVRNGYGGVEVDTNQFLEVYRTRFGKVRIYKIIGVDEESKKWVPENRVCDVPGSWFCPGQYPPAVQAVLNKGKTFVQLEDFNKNEDDSEYQKLYFEKLEGIQRQKVQRQKDLMKMKKKKDSSRNDL